MKDRIHIDVGVGDSEKLGSIISRKEANSRMKDFHDIFLMLYEKNLIDTARLKVSIDPAFQNRKNEKAIPINFSEQEYTQLHPLFLDIMHIFRRLPLNQA